MAKKREDYEKKAGELFSEMGVPSGEVKQKEETTGGKQKREWAFLIGVSHAISSILDVNELLDKIMDSALEVTGAERGFLMLYEEAEKKLDVKVARNIQKEQLMEKEFEVSKNVIAEVENKGEPLFISDAQTDPRFGGKESVVRYGLRSVLCVPLLYRKKMVGLLYLDNRTIAHLFTERELELMIPFATQAAISLENARTYNKIEEMRQTLELKVQERTKELEKKVAELKEFNDLAIGRELKMIELEKKVTELEKENAELKEKTGEEKGSST